MPFVRMQRVAPVVPVRPAVVRNRANPRFPVNHRPLIPPRPLPVLQAPTFHKKTNIIYEEEDQQDDELHDHTTPVGNDHRGRKVTRQISVRVPTFMPQQNYPKQPLSGLSTRPIRHAEPKYPSHIYPPR